MQQSADENGYVCSASCLLIPYTIPLDKVCSYKDSKILVKILKHNTKKSSNTTWNMPPWRIHAKCPDTCSCIGGKVLSYQIPYVSSVYTYILPDIGYFLGISIVNQGGSYRCRGLYFIRYCQFSTRSPGQGHGSGFDRH